MLICAIEILNIIIIIIIITKRQAKLSVIKITLSIKVGENIETKIWHQNIW